MWWSKISDQLNLFLRSWSLGFRLTKRSLKEVKGLANPGLLKLVTMFRSCRSQPNPRSQTNRRKRRNRKKAMICSLFGTNKGWKKTLASRKTQLWNLPRLTSILLRVSKTNKSKPSTIKTLLQSSTSTTFKTPNQFLQAKILWLRCKRWGSSSPTKQNPQLINKTWAIRAICRT